MTEKYTLWCHFEPLGEKFLFFTSLKMTKGMPKMTKSMLEMTKCT